MGFSSLIASLPELPYSRTTTGLVVLSVYFAFCRALRYLRRDQNHERFPYKTRADFSNMTAQHAWEIVRYVMSLEFPWVSEKALQFALFRTYGIPTVSKLLCETRQLSELQYAPRRYADTSILIVEFLSHSPDSHRANSAIARMSWLHGKYQKLGKISNNDMLYTLSLFVLEIERWIRLYEWRTLTLMEVCALGTLWKSIGDAMGIVFDDLAHGPTNFRDGLEFFQDLELWADAYEKRMMVPNKWNHQLADETTAILLNNVPGPGKPAGKKIVAALMDDRLRKAMLYDDPPAIYPRLVHFLLETRKLLLRYLLPPRPYYLRSQTVSEEPDRRTGRYYQTVYESEPWYVQPTFWSRNSPSSWLRWALGRPYPDGKNYRPEGYHIFEVGPQNFEEHGQDECEATKERLMNAGRGGCPFGFK